MSLFRFPAALAFALLPMLAAAPATAETWATCTGYVTSLPTVISTQGTWCMDRDLSTGASSGTGIDIVTNNVTIDCNGYKLGNLAAGATTTAIGIRAVGRRNLTLRNCHVRGFASGIHLSGNVTTAVNSAGHVVEDSIVEASTVQGIVVQGRNSVVRRNRVLDIGGNASSLGVTGIGALGTVDVLDNLVDGAETAAGSVAAAWGIYADAVDGIVIARNRVRGVVPASGFGYGIFVVGTAGTMSSIRENSVFRAHDSTLWIKCSPGYRAYARDNAAMGWTFGQSDCYAADELETL